MYHCPFQGKSLVDDVVKLDQFRSDSHVTSSDGYKSKFMPCFYDFYDVLALN